MADPTIDPNNSGTITLEVRVFETQHRCVVGTCLGMLVSDGHERQINRGAVTVPEFEYRHRCTASTEHRTFLRQRYPQYAYKPVERVSNAGIGNAGIGNVSDPVGI